MAIRGERMTKLEFLVVVIFLCIIITPISSCHVAVKTRQSLCRRMGVELSYREAMFGGVRVVVNDGRVRLSE